MRLLVSALACCLLAAPVQAADELKIDPQARFEHRYSKIVVPPTLGGIPRTQVTQFAPDQLDVAFSYATEDNGEVATLYLYRLASGSMPLWFDRARLVIEGNEDAFGNLRPLDRDPAFVPPGQSTASGLLKVYAAEGAYASTGLAMVQVGEWLVKLRLSSASLSPEQLQHRIANMLAELQWPKRIPAAPAAVPVAACASPLPSRPPAEPAADEAASSAVDTMLGRLLASAAPKPNRAPTRWCRDSAMESGAAVYRADGETDAYLLALSDAGRAIRVQPSLMSHGAAQSRKAEGVRSWSVAFIDLGRTISFAPLASLPPAEQTMELLSNGRQVSVAQTWGRTRTVELSEGARP